MLRNIVMKVYSKHTQVPIYLINIIFSTRTVFLNLLFKNTTIAHLKNSFKMSFGKKKRKKEHYWTNGHNDPLNINTNYTLCSIF